VRRCLRPLRQLHEYWCAVMSQNIRPGLLLDLDGTLADSLGVMRKIYGQFLAGFDRPSSQAEFDRLNGPSLLDVVKILKRDHDLGPPVKDLLRIYKSYLNTAYVEVLPNKGARELIDAAVSEGWAVSVVSSNVKDTAVSWLEKVGLRDQISVVATGDTVARGKPAPDLYLKAIQDSGCDVALSYAVEDTLTGVRSAVDAGLTTFALAAGGGQAADWPEEVRTITCLDQLIPLLQLPGAGMASDV
jgi:HAD superfamily hydrolase (TIGR01509 family)